ncbi:MAG: hypothetical protein WCX69_01655 [Candidatus Paceibacterota bacterium]
MKAVFILAGLVLAMVMAVSGQEINLTQYNENVQTFTDNDALLYGEIHNPGGILEQIEGIKNGTIPVPSNGTVAAGPSLTETVKDMWDSYINATAPSNGQAVNQTPVQSGVVDQIIDRVEARASDAPTAVPGAKGVFTVEGNGNKIFASNESKDLSMKGDNNSIYLGEVTVGSDGFEDAKMSFDSKTEVEPNPEVQAYEQTVFPVVYSGEEVRNGAGMSFYQQVDSALSQGRYPTTTGRWNLRNGVRISFSPIDGGSEQAQLHRNPITGADEARPV